MFKAFYYNVRKLRFNNRAAANNRESVMYRFSYYQSINQSACMPLSVSLAGPGEPTKMKMIAASEYTSLNKYVWNLFTSIILYFKEAENIFVYISLSWISSIACFGFWFNPHRILKKTYINIIQCTLDYFTAKLATGLCVSGTQKWMIIKIK